MSRLLWICFAGALGTGSRYLLGGWVMGKTGAAFPFGTLVINFLGSFLIAVIMQLSETTGLVPPTLRLTLTTGFMGGFTTYSTFNYETVTFFREGAIYLGFLNFGLMSIACLIGGFGGVALTRIWTS
jgi:CrcB protein